MSKLRWRLAHVTKTLIDRPHIVFLVVALLIGLPVLILRPGYDTPDFVAHLAKAYDVSSGNIIADTLPSSDVVNKQPNDDNFKYVGGYLPVELAQYAFTFTPSYAHASRKVPANGQFGLYLDSTNDNNKVAFSYNTTAVYSPIAYAPQVVGIWIGRVLNLSVYAMALLASAAVFLAWLLLVFAAIKISPIGKWVMFTLALLPMTIFVAPSVSTDPFLIGMVFIFFAYLMRIFVSSEPIRLRQIVTLSILAAAIALLKQAYFPLIFSSLILYTRFPSKKVALKSFIAILLPAIVLFLAWSLIVSSGHFGITTQASPNEQLVNTIHNPLLAAKAVVKTSLLGLDGVIWSFFGTFGWLTLPIPLFAVAILSGTLVLAFMVAQDKKVHFNHTHLLIIGLSLLASVLLMLGSLYIYWTPLGSSSLEGLQGRYFIPLLIFISPLTLFLSLSKKANTAAKKVIACVVPVTLALTMYLLFRHYYL